MFRSMKSQPKSTDNSELPPTTQPSAEAGPSTYAASSPEQIVDPGTSGGTGRISALWQSMAADNPYFSAGAGLMGIGVVLTILRRGTTLAATSAQRRLLVTLEIPSKDRSYPWFLEWMSHQTSPPPSSINGAGSKLSNVWKGKSPMSLRSHELAVETSYKQHENGSSEAVFNLVPGPGTHYFRYGGSWFQVKRERDSKLMDLHSGTPWETLTLTTLSTSRHLFSGLLSEARELAEASTEGKTVVYTAWGVEWRPFGKPRRRREMGSVVLGKGVAERVEADVKGFLGRAKWYAERGIPYRRGYLLHGPPGSGKTSFIQALAGSLSYNICLLNLSERGLTDDKLNHLLGLVPERSFLLLEDVDSAFNRREQTTEEGFKSSVTFSGLLNALDGVASSEERIIFMTTNHFDRLDPALIRPGRVDIKEHLGDAAGEQAKRLFIKFYGRSNKTSGSSSVSTNLPSEGRFTKGDIEMTDDTPHPTESNINTVGESKDSEEIEKLGVWRKGEEIFNQDEIENLGSKVEQIVQSLQDEGKSISMAALQGHFIRCDAREAVDGIPGLIRDGKGR